MTLARQPLNIVRGMPSIYDEATAVRRVSDIDGTIRFDAEVMPGWDIAGNANGGYLLGIAARAMASVAERPPLTITAHYLAPAPAGACHVDVTPIRSGRRLATLSAGMWQGERQILQLLGTFGDQSDDRTVHYTDGVPPVMPDWATMEPNLMPPIGTTGGAPPIAERLELRMRPEDAEFHLGVKTGRAEIGGWLAFADHAPFDAFSLMFAADAMAPPVFNTEVPVGWVPTIELTVHVRGVPAPGPLRCVFRSRFIQGGLLDEDGELWDSAGVLVAQSRQLALVPRG